ncbi:MAG: phospho-sugar mutase, partial [bacterium]|nr:phospho-sugar mutase [bacterium]
MASMASFNWSGLSGRVAAEFQAQSDDAALVERALGNLKDWLEEPIYSQHRPFLLAHIEQAKYPLLLDATYQYVPFGTGGRRGRVGYGPNRINEVTVSLSVQGHCSFLRDEQASAETAIVVACDTRIFRDLAGNYTFLPEGHPVLGLTSRALARRAAEIYAGNGIVAYLPGGEETDYLSTPELSYLIRYLKAAGGVNMSASHNHPDDNGFKFFNAEGGQETPPRDERLAGYMDGVREAKRLDFAEGAKQGLIRAIPEATHRSYIDLNLALTPHRSNGEFPVVYTPLCGTGDTTVGDLLREAGYRVVLHEPHATGDGTFASVPSRLPNPENPDSATPAIETADAVGATVVLSTDPDADRLGVYARSGSGDWKYFTGNDIASVLAYYLVVDPGIGHARKGFLIKTLVTSRTLDDICRRGGCQIVPDLLVGFKYIAEVLGSIERTGEYDGVTGTLTDMVMAGEESHGLLFTPEIRDKDAAAAALLLCELASKLASRGGTLPEYLDRVVLECGNFVNVARSIVLRGIPG